MLAEHVMLIVPLIHCVFLETERDDITDVPLKWRAAPRVPHGSKEPPKLTI